MNQVLKKLRSRRSLNNKLRQSHQLLLEMNTQFLRLQDHMLFLKNKQHCSHNSRYQKEHYMRSLLKPTNYMHLLKVLPNMLEASVEYLSYHLFQKL